MRTYIIAAAICVLSIPAAAQDASFDVLCLTLPDAQVVNDVEYKPGVDVNGKAVVPADINALDASVADVINIPVTVDLVQKFSLMNMQGIELKPDVSNIAIHKDGRVSYNGQDISKQAYSVCAKNVEIRETVLTPAPAKPKSASALAEQSPAAPLKAPPAALQASGQPHDKSLDLPIVPKIAVPDKAKDEVIEGQYP
jgi:hypothetical protein